MASKHPACHSSGHVRLSPASTRPAPEVEARLREVFPEIWARYEWLVAARSATRRGRKSRS
jgi:hypothetical protein